MRIEDSFPRFVIVLLIAALMAKLLLFFLGATRGFDLVDEGYHMLHYSFPNKYTVNVHNYQHLLAKLPNWLRTVSSLRILWLLTEGVSSIVLVHGALKFFPERVFGRFEKTLIFLLVLQSAWMSVNDRILAYNGLSNFFCYSIMGLTLVGLAEERKTYKSILFIVVGAFFCAQGLVKPTASLGVAGLCLAILLSLGRKDSFFVTVVSTITGALFFSVLFLTTFVSDPSDWWENYRSGLELAKAAGYGSELQMKAFFLNMAEFIGIVGLALVPSLILAKRLLRGVNGEKGQFAVIAGCHILATLLLLSVLVVVERTVYVDELNRFSSSHQYHLIFILPVSTFYFWFASRLGTRTEPIRISVVQRIITISLGTMPVFIFFGAMSSVSVSLFGHAVPIFLATVLMLVSLYSRPISKSLLIYVSVLFSGLFFGFYLNNQWYHPARLLSSLGTQQVTIPTLENATNLKFDIETAEFITRLSSKGRFDTRPIIHIGNHPGIVYLLGGYQPGTAMYISLPFDTAIEPMNLAYAKVYLERNKLEVENSILIINAGVHPDYFRKVGKGGMLLTESHVLKDSVYNPYLKREMQVNSLIKHPYTYVYESARK